jgi:hypothetical protein
MANPTSRPCGHAHDDPILEVARKVRCAGEPMGCPLAVTAFIVSLRDPGRGLHVNAPLELTASCRRHHRRVLRQVTQESVHWLRPAVAKPHELPAVFEWFHGDSGLCENRAIAVATQGGMET